MLLEAPPFDGATADPAVSSDYRPSGLTDYRKPKVVLSPTRYRRQFRRPRIHDVRSDLGQRPADLDQVLVDEPAANRHGPDTPKGLRRRRQPSDFVADRLFDVSHLHLEALGNELHRLPGEEELDDGFCTDPSHLRGTERDLRVDDHL